MKKKFTMREFLVSIISSLFGGGVVVNALDCHIVVSEFELLSRWYVYF